MPPWGGLNGNTGVADAHNLAWKLAHVIRGEDGPELLDSYEAERQPVARRNAEQAQLRGNYELRFGIRTDANRDVFDRLRDGGELLMRYRYGDNDTVEALNAQTGTRFPHAWIEKDGRRLSTLDLFGSGTAAIGGPAATGDGVLRAGKDFRFVNDDMTWSALTSEGDDAAVRVRPDSFVAAR